MALNRDLLRRTLEHIEAHVEEHDQGDWRTEKPCGMTMCFGGWAVTLAGGRWIPGTNALEPEVDDPDFTRFTPTDEAGRVALSDVKAVSCEDRAQRVLGLDDGEAYKLFYECVDLDDLRFYVSGLLKMKDAL